MRTLFYRRTAYPMLNVSVPDCFIQLDEYFGTLFANTSGLMHQSTTLAHNLCRRMADIELYASFISQAANNPDIFQGATVAGTFLVGYFTGCKSLLDAGAIALARLYNLTLKNKEMDVSKPKFWKELKGKEAAVHERYTRFKGLFNEVIEWRDSAVHRITPFVIVHSPGSPEEIPRDKKYIKMVAKSDVEISTVVKMSKNIPWVEPLHFHRKWQRHLTEFCEEVCLDIRSKT